MNLSKVKSEVDDKSLVAKEEVDDKSKTMSSANNTGRTLNEKPKTVSGRDIITEYMKGDPVAIVTYRKICNALEVLENWETPAKIQFLEQFLNMSDLLDSRCTLLVTNLSKLPWQCIPLDIVERYKLLLCEIAVRQVCHTDLIYQTAATNLLPKMKKVEETVQDPDCSNDMKPDSKSSPKFVRMFEFDEEDRIFTLAHQVIAHIHRCFPMSFKHLLMALQKAFPHYTLPSEVFIGYIRNIIQITEYVPKIAPSLWSMVFDNLVLSDCIISRRLTDKEAAKDNSSGIFVMDDICDDGDVDLGAEEKTAKLDGAISDVFTYLSLKHGYECTADTAWLRIGDLISADDVFRMLLPVLENRLLMSVHVRYTSFIYLHLASLDESYSTRLLEFLWTIVSRPHRAQSDSKKAHGAAAYMAAFLARAKYIKISDAFSWMHRLLKWCIQYVELSSVAQIVPGVSRHGTFYSVCQAFFIAFSFRYRELVRTGDIEEVRRWGLGRVVHSPLEPLKFVSKAVGLCFAAISRSLQLVYCNHVLSWDQTMQRPFEPMFPLDSYHLKRSESVVTPLMRRFSPLAEDVSVLSTALDWDQKGKEKVPPTAEQELDYLDDDDLLGSMIGRNGSFIQCGPQSAQTEQGSIFTVYSTSPGLRHYDSLMNMR